MTFRRRVVVLHLGVALIAISAVAPLASGAATTLAAKPTGTTPNVSSVTVTVTGTQPPPATVTTTAAKPQTVTSAPVTPSSAPAPRTASTPATPTLATTPTTPTPASTSTAPTSVADGASSTTRSNIVLTQPQLRSVVVRLSSCLSRLTAKSQRMLLDRAGILMSAPASRLAVARALGVGVARERMLEGAALQALQTAARQNSCGSPPAWIHVPAGDRLVLIDPVLTGKPAT